MSFPPSLSKGDLKVVASGRKRTSSNSSPLSGIVLSAVDMKIVDGAVTGEIFTAGLFSLQAVGIIISNRKKVLSFMLKRICAKVV
jgi:hypothetical protein